MIRTRQLDGSLIDTMRPPVEDADALLLELHRHGVARIYSRYWGAGARTAVRVTFGAGSYVSYDPGMAERPDGSPRVHVVALTSHIERNLR